MVLPLRRVALCLSGLSELPCRREARISRCRKSGKYDCIAGYGLITKTGSGDLVLNADDNDFASVAVPLETGEVPWVAATP